MTIRALLHRLLLGGLLALAACGDAVQGPVAVSAIGGEPDLANPNLEPLDPASAYLLEATAQGLVRFDAQGQVEPALAQSWIVSDDGLRYTFRLARTQWADGDPVTAAQVVQRLRAAISRASDNPLKPVLGVIDEIEAMTPEVLEITLVQPRPNFLQLLAQPELAIIRNGTGTGPYRAEAGDGGALVLTLPKDEEDEEEGPLDEILLRGEPAALAIVRFRENLADLVVGGTAAELPIVRAAETPAAALRFDPVAGLFGLAFRSDEGVLAEPEVRRVLSMAIDRAALVTALAVPDLQPRQSILPTGVADLLTPAEPAWSGLPLTARQQSARTSIAVAAKGEPVRLEVAVPPGPGYRLVFAHIRRDWRAIGVEAVAVEPAEDADLALIDSVAPANLASWYLRRFTCAEARVCSEEADAALEAARASSTLLERQAQLAAADRLLTEAAVFIPLTAPVRWSLVSPRLTGFQVNPFARHFAGRLIAGRP